MWTNESKQFLDTLWGEPVVEKLHGYLQQWNWPKRYSNASKIAETGQLKGDGSEQMALAEVMEYWLSSTTCPAGFAAEKASMRSLCKIVLLLTVVIAGVVTADTLHDQIQEHAKLHQLAYGIFIRKPKNHFVQHLAEQMARVLAC